MSMGDGKAGNVIEYLDNLIDKGKASQGAISPLKVAFSKVLRTIDGERWDDTDVKSIDIDDYMDRFANLTMGKYASDSLTVYKSRVNKAINWYVQFLDKPGWTPDVQRRNRVAGPKAKRAGGSAGGRSINVTSAPASNETSPQSMPSVANAPNRILYPYPLIDGQLVHFSLPVKLSKTDARRIGIFIESIAIEDENISGTNHDKA